MITVAIGGEPRSDTSIDAMWLAQQINRRRRDGVPVCVVVDIREPGLRMTLRTADCGPGVPGGRRLNETERQVFELWRQHGLDASEFSPGDLIAFLQQVERI
jgi:hypothetical protein